MCELFGAVTREGSIDKLENFVWKVAHFVWCNHLKHIKRKAGDICLEESMVPTPVPDHSDAVIDHMALELELHRMRQVTVNLSRTQRDIMILHYIDGLSVSEVATRLKTTDGAVKWHLLDARNRVRKELIGMESGSPFAYRPGRLSVAISGNGGPDPDTRRLKDSLIRQNLALLCYREGRTIDELVRQTGIPKPYLEFDLD